MATVMTVCKEDLSLPVVDPVRLFLYNNTASFASYGQGWRRLPIDVDATTAFVRGKNIHINLAKTPADRWGHSIELLAHEYGHTMEAFVGRQHVSPWFSEGFASWVAAKVLDSLKWQDYELALERSTVELSYHHDLLAPLSQLNWHWKSLANTPRGRIKTYILAFVAVDRLVQRSGVAATLQYIKGKDFPKSFGLSLQDFETDFAAHISGLRPSPKSNGMVMPMPVWNVGDYWTYAVKHAGAQTMLTRTIAREDKLDGAPSYVMTADDEELLYSKNTLALLAVMKNGDLTGRRHTASQPSSWPLSLGKRWRNAYVWEDLSIQRKRTIDRTLVVSDIEKVAVPAGTFSTARIQSYSSNSGRLMSEHWYSPDVKWFVKIKDYSEIAFTEEQLTDFRTK